MVYNIRYLYQIPNADGTPGTDGPYECVTSVRANSSAGALAASKIIEVPLIVQITGVFPATSTSFM